MIKKINRIKTRTILFLIVVFMLFLTAVHLYAGPGVVTIKKAPLKDSAYKMLWSLYSTGFVSSFPEDGFFTGSSNMDRMDTARATLYFIRNLRIPMYELPDPALNRLEELVNIHEKEIALLQTNPESIRKIISSARKQKWYIRLKNKYGVRCSGIQKQSL